MDWRTRTGGSRCQSAGGASISLARAGRVGPSFSCNAFAQGLQRGLVGRAFDLDPIDFFHLEARVGNMRLELAVVGQQQQAFAVRIQPAGHIHTGNRDEVLEPAPPPFRRELAEHAVGLVEENQA